MNKRLVKSKDKKLFGVAGGLAEYFNVDPLLMRVLIVVLSLGFGIVIVGYILLAIWMPKPAEDDA
jgi:phage shock protein C